MTEGAVDILVVDDDPWIVELVVMAAEERGWSVLSAANGTGGIECLQTSQPRLVLLDVRLPWESGWDVLANIKHVQPDHPPVIMMTADHMDEAEQDLQGATAILSKPFGLQQFWSLLGEHLDP